APAVAETVNPHLAERVPEDGRAITARAGAQDSLAPVNAIRREMDRQPEPARLAVRAEHLVASFRVLFLQIEPDRGGIPAVGLYNAGPLAEVQLGLGPAEAILGKGVASTRIVTTEIPHLEQAVPGVVPDAVTEGHRHAAEALSLPLLVRSDEGVVRVRPRRV